jgi:hypothetical protein
MSNASPTDREILIGILNAIGVIHYRITGNCLEIPIETASGDFVISCGRRTFLAEHPAEEVASLTADFPATCPKHS